MPQYRVHTLEEAKTASGQVFGTHVVLAHVEENMLTGQLIDVVLPLIEKPVKENGQLSVAGLKQGPLYELSFVEVKTNGSSEV